MISGESNRDKWYKLCIPKKGRDSVTKIVLQKVKSIIDHKKFEHCGGAEGLYVLHIVFSKWYFSLQEHCVATSTAELVCEL